MGAFKFRGAYNAISKMGPEVSTIITHSSGNHAQAIALAAKMAGKKVCEPTYNKILYYYCGHRYH